MFFIARYEHNISRFDCIPSAIAINLAFSCMNEYFMFPIMRMLRGISAGRNLKDAHAKIIRTVSFADCNTPCYPFCFVAFKMRGFDIGIFLYLHIYPLLKEKISDYFRRNLAASGAK